MDRSNVPCNQNSGDASSVFEEVQRAFSNFQMPGYAYGIRCMTNNISRESIQSACEASEYESIANDTLYYSIQSAGDGTISPPEMFKSIISSPSPLESASSASPASDTSSTSDNYTMSSEAEDKDLPDVLRGVKNSFDNAQWNTKLRFAPLKSNQSTPIKLDARSINIPYPKLLIDQYEVVRTPSKKKISSSDAQVVHDMVVEKYEDSYKRLLQKLKKLNLSVEENKFQKVIAQLETMFQKNGDSKVAGILRNVALARNESSGGDNNDVKEASYKKFVSDAPSSEACNVQREESTKSKESEYDEHQFLETAIGEELLRDASSEEYLFPPTVSIDTDDVSALLSSRSTLVPSKRRRRPARKSLITNSDYEPATFTCESTTPDLINEPFRYSYASYEDVTNLGVDIYTDEGKKQVKKHIYINENIIEQTEKMLEYGLRKQPHFIGSHAHLEGERILLVSKMRRQVLLNYLYRISEPRDEPGARVTVENLKCILKPSEDDQQARQYFVCILQHKTTVYSTRIAAPNKLSWVDFGGFFIFDNVSNTFNIKIQLHAINIPRGTRTWLTLPFFKCIRKLPAMELIGEVHIGMLNVKNKKFTFKNIGNIKSKEHKLSASVEASVNWPDNLKGFLTIGTSKIDQQPVWNRRWCVLEGSKLNYYNYPSDEIFCHPAGVIDFGACVSCHEASLKYLDQKVLRLFFQDSEDFKRVLLSPDTAEEYDSWSKRLETILRLVKEWDVLK